MTSKQALKNSTSISSSNVNSKFCPMGQMKRKFGTPITNLFFTYYSKPSDLQDLGLTPYLRGPGNTTWVNPQDENYGEVKLTPILSTVQAALTHDRILKEGERIMERVMKMFKNDKNEALHVQRERLMEKHKIEIHKITEVIDAFQKRQKENYEDQLETTINCIKERLAHSIGKAMETVSIIHRNELKNYIHKNEVEKIRKQYDEDVKRKLDKHKKDFEKCLAYLIQKEVKKVIEVMETQNERNEQAIKKESERKSLEDRAKMEAALRQVEADHMNDLLHNIFAERASCEVKVDDVKKSCENSRKKHSESDDFKRRLQELEEELNEARNEVETWKTKTKDLADAFKNFLACILDEPLNQTDYLFPMDRCSTVNLSKISNMFSKEEVDKSYIPSQPCSKLELDIYKFKEKSWRSCK
ncbi:hypothetical protein M8J76_005176 [Diaphorina citri]|nr:hypothetical protein M8J75_010596 [Diaphorina citri]KAI5716363.1 hypothetical protein M8J76_005176 [Diaphorina citri]KAI5718637.1 hypothetical protein M8J77_024407 [Diaphorina citri]